MTGQMGSTAGDLRGAKRSYGGGAERHWEFGEKIDLKSQNEGFIGEVEGFSEMQPCSSCAGILSEQMTNAFGGKVKVKVNFGTRYGKTQLGAPEFYRINEWVD